MIFLCIFFVYLLFKQIKRKNLIQNIFFVNKLTLTIKQYITTQSKTDLYFGTIWR